MKAVAGECSILDNVLVGGENKRKSKLEINQLYMLKCIHTIFFMVQKFFALTDNYQDMIEFFSEKLHEPITAQYLNNCQQNATYKSNMSAESVLDAINVYFKAITLKEIQQANFLPIYADESENSSHKECFSMFMSLL